MSWLKNTGYALLFAGAMGCGGSHYEEYNQKTVKAGTDLVTMTAVGGMFSPTNYLDVKKEDGTFIRIGLNNNGNVTDAVIPTLRYRPNQIVSRITYTRGGTFAGSDRILDELEEMVRTKYLPAFRDSADVIVNEDLQRALEIIK